MPNGAAILQIMKQKSNQFCADCSHPDPNWISVNTGALVCLDCAQIHRSLPSSVSQVKSLTADVLHATTVTYLLTLPNEVVNNIYEAIPPPPHLRKPTPASANEDLKNWITEKYLHKSFVSPFAGTRVQLHQALVDAIRLEDIPGFLQLIAQGANPQPITCDGIHILHLAIEEGLSVMVEALVLSGVDVNIRDKNDGRTSVFFAIEAGNLELVKLLVGVHEADLTVKNTEGYNALTYAQTLAQQEPDYIAFKQICEYLRRKVGQIQITQVNANSSLPSVTHSSVETDLQRSGSKFVPVLEGENESSSSHDDGNFDLSDYM